MLTKDYSPKNRLVHLVLNQNDILEISKKTDGFPNKMDFSIMPSADNLPLTTMTENAQFKLNLSWEPQNIKSDSTTTFFFEVLDAFLLDRQVSVGYDLSILHGGERVFQTNGISNDSVHSMIEFEIPDDVTGMITLQFENLNGSDLADASFHVVVDRVVIHTLGNATIGQLIVNGFACSISAPVTNNVNTGAVDFDYMKVGNFTMDATSRVGDGDGIDAADLVVNTTVSARSIVNNLVDTPLAVR